MIRPGWLAAGLLALAWALPASAQTRAWLDRPQVTQGETTTLNIETHQAVDQVDYAPLRRQFDLAGQTVRRSFTLANGRQRTRTVFAVGLRPRAPGVLTVPALQVGSDTTQPQRLVVLPPDVVPAGARADAFVETRVDARRPYVQQAVGVVVRLHYAVPLLSGQLDQDAPAGASLQRVGEDLTYQRELGGRRYHVVERRYLLLPERSGALLLPGARFHGQALGGFLDDLFGDGRKPLSVAAAAQRLQVLPVPPDAPQPWLPLRELRLRWLQAPTAARVGEATTLELELTADGASAAQLPAPALPEPAGAQLFADPVQADERFVDGRPRTTVRRRIAIVPLQAGTVSLDGPRIAWWDAVHGVARTAQLPPLRLQVAGGSAPVDAAADTATEAASAGVRSPRAMRMSGWPWLAAAAAVFLLLAFARRRHRRGQGPGGLRQADPPREPDLREALRAGDLAGIAHALTVGAGAAGDPEATRRALDDVAQQEAWDALQSARWGGGDGQAALAQLRAAFAGGARWRARRAEPPALLPPLYPRG